MNEKNEIGTLARSYTELIKHNNNYIENIREIEGEKERINAELDIATRIQASSLPTEAIETDEFIVDGFSHPAREVGGDFYEYFKIDDDNIYFVIGDVSGKGIPATLFMVKTMYLIKDHAKFNEDLSQVIEKVNNLAYERNDKELFVTIWLGKLNLKTGKLSYVNAGHNQPLIKHDSDDFEYLKTRANLVIGGIEGIQYNEHEINLNAGDMIFLYTDGVTEANYNYNEFYGKNRLKETINKNKTKKWRYAWK